MRQFGRIETAIWQNPKFRSLSDDGRALWLYALCCPHGNAVGCFVLPTGYIMADLGWGQERASATVSELFAKGLIDRDETTSLTRVRGWWGHNTIENGNVAKGAIKAIVALPRCAVLSRFLADFERFPKALENELRNTFPNGYPNGIETKEPEPEPEKISDPSDRVPKPSPLDLKSQIFGPCLDWLAERTGRKASAHRSLLGKWLRDYGEPAVLAAFMAAQKESPVEPVAWLERALAAGGPNGRVSTGGRRPAYDPEAAERERREAIYAAIAPEIAARGDGLAGEANPGGTGGVRGDDRPAGSLRPSVRSDGERHAGGDDVLPGFAGGPAGGPAGTGHHGDDADAQVQHAAEAGGHSPTRGGGTVAPARDGAGVHAEVIDIGLIPASLDRRLVR